MNIENKVVVVTGGASGLGLPMLRLKPMNLMKTTCQNSMNLLNMTTMTGFLSLTSGKSLAKKS